MYSKFSELSNDEIIQSIKKFNTFSQILRNLNCLDNPYNRKLLTEFIKLNEIDTSHIKIRITRKIYEENPKYCKFCGKVIPYEKRDNEFCDHSCAASYNNKGICRNGNKLPEHSYCLNCNKEINRGNKFCNSTCQAEYNEKQYIEKWKNGEKDGISGKYGIIKAVRRYIFKKNDYKCQKCHKNYINPYTNLSILQIHHIDGDCTNNKEENLQLLCPNCHAMTENYGSRNQNATRKDNRQRF